MAGRARVVLTMALFACTSHDVIDASPPAPDAKGDCALCDATSIDYDGNPTIPPPEVACIDAGDDAALCPLPRSICVDTQWLEYFDNGVCEDGGCHFDVLLKSCPYNSCREGGCTIEHPTVNAPR